MLGRTEFVNSMLPWLGHHDLMKHDVILLLEILLNGISQINDL